MKIKDIISKNLSVLKEVTDIPQKEIYIFLGFILEKDFIWLTLNQDYELSFSQLQKINDCIKKRATHYPVEYITNRVSFYGEEFNIYDGVLIPRPETELLVDKAYDILKEITSPNIVEIGTGSGIISTMLAKKIENINITAVDINPKALELAKLNASKHNVSHKIDFVLSDLFTNVKDAQYHMIVSNPPYIANDFELPKNVLYEPKEALFGGNKGDELIVDIVNICINKNIKYFCCEMGYDQKEPLSKIFDQNGWVYEFYSDYSGFDRGFILRLKE
ncbi:peptide chain release factor N(5)-glutamine methyltransferase [Arcobacter sp. FWKO B]|uniref:peptide chain release factor N(5)-glutamine methyltransferase n=1 Tax=Arcobacter sp. FWKO B TaxID=2593672 RepID=UPI0018A3E28A|nr:peptide chain release factor N(5)-glutamine methyltransferase [Arcobacter sp. FWKO B]QOG11310.1 peptide chain release factor N(5)-glutamine methyltransferase [Arcobacter sp. FWKO B]